jgi:hypothetical protein
VPETDPQDSGAQQLSSAGERLNPLIGYKVPAWQEVQTLQLIPSLQTGSKLEGQCSAVGSHCGWHPQQSGQARTSPSL